MKYFLVSLVVLLMVFPMISAVALSQDYHNLNPLRVSPGDSVDVVFGRFQNNGDVDKTIEITLVDDAGIATLLNDGLDSFVISAGDSNVPLNVRVSIPADVVKGTEYTILVNYKDVSSSDASGMITFTDSKTVSIPVIADEALENPSDSEQDKSSLFLWIAIIVGVILIGLIIFWIIKLREAEDVPETSNSVMKKR